VLTLDGTILASDFETAQSFDEMCCDLVDHGMDAGAAESARSLNRTARRRDP